MPNNPKVTGDGEIDSWSFQVTQEVNDLQTRTNRGPRLPGNARFGDEFYIPTAYTDGSDTIAIGWYKYVDADIEWVQL